jgi:hypothetical protein
LPVSFPVLVSWALLWESFACYLPLSQTTQLGTRGETRPTLLTPFFPTWPNCPVLPCLALPDRGSVYRRGVTWPGPSCDCLIYTSWPATCPDEAFARKPATLPSLGSLTITSVLPPYHARSCPLSTWSSPTTGPEPRRTALPLCLGPHPPPSNLLPRSVRLRGTLCSRELLVSPRRACSSSRRRNFLPSRNAAVSWLPALGPTSPSKHSHLQPPDP